MSEEKTEILNNEEPKLEKTQEELLHEQKEKYLSIIADYENRMKRTKQDAIHSINLAIENITLDLAPLVQDLNKAIELSNDENKIGIELIKKNMQSTLKRYGVEEIEPKVGDQFDNNLHQALTAEEKENIPEGEILKVIQPGYKVKDRTILPASVIIAA